MRADNAVNNDDYWSFVRSETIGRDAVIDTAMGRRVVTYADFTASGRAVRFVEDYVLENLKLYGNTHTEDDATGRVIGRRLVQAESMLKRLVNSGQERPDRNRCGAPVSLRVFSPTVSWQFKRNDLGAWILDTYDLNVPNDQKGGYYEQIS